MIHVNRIWEYLDDPSYGPAQPSSASPLEPPAQKFEQMVRSVEVQVTNNPRVAIGIALTLGIIIGWIVKRR